MNMTIELSRDSNVVYVTATGKLTDEDYRYFVPQMEKLIDAKGKLRLLFDMKNFRGWDLHAAWDDFKFGVRHAGDFQRIALVGSKKWQKWMSKVYDLFTSAEVRYYDRTSLNEARRWIDDSAGEPAFRAASTTASTPRAVKPTHDQIALRAFCLWEQRGRIRGADEQIWLEAEAALQEELNTPTRPARRPTRSLETCGDPA